MEAYPRARPHLADRHSPHKQQPDEPEELGEVVEDDAQEGAENDESKTIVPNKVHIRGLDTLTTDDIRNYVKSHFGLPDRVEWIDDTSANLLFGAESTARDALVALSSIEILDPTALAIGETLPAKPLEGRPEISLHVRTAVQSDRKQAGAALRSRFYLLNPEYDPEERRRHSRYRDRHGDDRRGGRRSYRRDSDERPMRFEASMYDDAPSSSRKSHSPDRPRPRSYADENRGKELFAGRSGRDRRDRSASPLRDGDVDMDADRRASSSGNREAGRSIRDRLAGDDRRKNRDKELFPKKELFPSKMSSGRGGGQLDQLESAIGSAHLREEDRPKVVNVPSDPSGATFNIRGVARGQDAGDGGGFSIRGAANAKELFPGKLGGSNAGKELFDGRGKRASRQKAEDLFG